MTLRAKLLLTALGLVAIALVVSDFASTTTLRSYLLDQTDKQLGAAADPVSRRLTSPTTTAGDPSAATSVPGVPRAQPPTANPFISDFFIQVRSPTGVVENQYTPTIREAADPIPALPQALVASHLGRDPFTVGSEGNSAFTYRVSVSATPNGDTLIAAVPLRTVENTIDRLRNIELTVSLVILLLLGLAAWWIVRVELRQLDRMAKTAGAIAAGDLSKRVATSHPHTEVGRLSEALNSMLSQIEASFIEKQASEDRLRRFAADASHELRTPLTAIRGYAELFRQGAIADQDHLARILQRIESEASRMGLMVEDLLTLARLDQSRPAESGPVDIVKTVSDVVNDSRVVANNRVLRSEYHVAEAFVTGDAARLHQVFSNLIGNALTHTAAESSVDVSIQIVDRSVRVDIKDDGPGLPADAVSHVFERFYRVDAGRSRNTGGTGLGLAIVKSIVDAHDGQVSVASVPGEGACFSVLLPLLRSDTGTESSAERDAQEVRSFQ